MKKSQKHVGLAQECGFGSQQWLHGFAVIAERRRQRCTPVEKSVLNMI
jgi:hypothetical protein